MPYQELLKQTGEWVNLIAAFVTIATFLGGIITFIGSIRQIAFQTAKVAADSPKIFSVIRLIQSTKKSTWGAFRNSTIIASIVILGYDVALVVGLVGALIIEKNQLIYSGLFGNLAVAKNQISFSGEMVVILILIIALPILLLLDVYKTELRLRRGERSRVFKWAEIEIIADYNSLLIRCFQVLSDIGARITHYNAVIGMVEAEFQRHIIVLEIRAFQNDRYTVYISSDCKKPTVKIDFGINQKIVNECATRLLGYR